MSPAAATAAGRERKSRSKDAASSGNTRSAAPRRSAPSAAKYVDEFRVTDQRPVRKRRELHPTPSSETSAFERVLGPEQRRGIAKPARRATASASASTPRPLTMASPRRRMPRMNTDMFTIPTGVHTGIALPHPHVKRPHLKRPAVSLPRVHRPSIRMPHVSRVRASQQLDRIIRSRLWIAIFGIMLVSVVAMRVEVLKLGTKTGAAVQTAAQLQAANAMEQAKLSELENPDRIARYAEQKGGMRAPSPTDTMFLSHNASHSVMRAIQSITRPNPAAFETNLANRQASDAQLTTGTTSTVNATGATTPAP